MKIQQHARTHLHTHTHTHTHTQKHTHTHMNTYARTHSCSKVQNNLFFAGSKVQTDLARRKHYTVRRRLGSVRPVYTAHQSLPHNHSHSGRGEERGRGEGVYTQHTSRCPTTTRTRGEEKNGGEVKGCSLYTVAAPQPLSHSRRGEERGRGEGV